MSGKNDPYGAADLQEGWEFGWEPLDKGDITQSYDDASGVMAGNNVWPSEEDIAGFREASLKY